MKYFAMTDRYGQELVRAVTENAVLWIPADPANSDYQVYLAWVAEGNTAEQWSPQ